MAIDKIRAKRWITALLLLLLLASISTTVLLGCAHIEPKYPEEVAAEVTADRLMVERYLLLMDEGKTTRAQDQGMLASCYTVLLALEEIMTTEEED